MISNKGEKSNHDYSHIIDDQYRPESQDDATAETTSQPQPAAADPRDDYYRYINEAALADAEFDYGAMTAAEGLDQHIVDEQLHELFDRVMSMDGYEPGTEEFIIKNAYEQYMSYEGDHTPQELRDLIGQIDEIRTTKKDKAGHGFGVHNIRTAAANYGGELMSECKETPYGYDFCLEMIFPVG